jgi:predicted RND superfamily exporter protein
MQTAQEIAQQTDAAKTAVVLIAIVLVAFWRTVLRVLLAIIAIAIVTLFCFGALVILQGTHP